MTIHLEVSDHACLRWLERRHGIDLDAIRAEIHMAALPAATLGATRISVHGVTIVIGQGENGCKRVVTVLPVQSPGNSREAQAIAGGFQRGKTNITRSELGRVKRRDRQRANRTPA